MRINFGTLPWFSPFRFSTFRTRPGPLHPAVLPMILFVALFFGAAPAWCQLDPNTLQGLTPYASFHGGDLDSVNLGSGKLDIHIPLLSYPQRGGKLRMSFTVRYLDSENYTFKTCNKVGTDCEQGTSKEAGALFVVPDFLISLVATGKEGLTNLDGVQTSDFATHPLLPVSGSTSRSVDATDSSSIPAPMWQPTAKARATSVLPVRMVKASRM